LILPISYLSFIVCNLINLNIKRHKKGDDFSPPN
jgi:hypothetical protein